MAKRLNYLTGKDIVFVDENQEETRGILFQIPPKGFKKFRNSYFFISSEKAPFRITSRGKNRVAILKGPTRMCGSSNMYDRIANEEELQTLTQLEGLCNSANPKNEIQGRGHEPWVSKYITQREPTKKELFPQGYCTE